MVQFGSVDAMEILDEVSVTGGEISKNNTPDSKNSTTTPTKANEKKPATTTNKTNLVDPTKKTNQEKEPINSEENRKAIEAQNRKIETEKYNKAKSDFGKLFGDGNDKGNKASKGDPSGKPNAEILVLYLLF